MNTFLGDFNAKFWRGGYFKTDMSEWESTADSDDIGVRIVNFAT